MRRAALLDRQPAPDEFKAEAAESQKTPTIPDNGN